MKLQVLLSTYNGEKYLREQLDSILSQTLFHDSDWETELVVRDDGSSDHTCEILEEYARHFSKISLHLCKNIGVIDSFFELLQNTSEDIDFVALSDQDDVWLEDKLECAVKALSGKEQDKPLLYCGMSQLVDEKLRPIKGIFFTNNIRPSFGNALVENICTGCTAVLNKKMIRLVKCYRPEFTAMHDWWLYLLATCYGDVVYDPVPHMYYRQHKDNVVGVRKSYFAEFVMRVKRYRKNHYKISRQVQSLWDLAEENNLMPKPEKKEMMKKILWAGKRISCRFSIISDKRIFRQRRIDNWIFKIIFLSGKV